ncbi:GNAT family N-acetyltransferase [Vagococcus entomophilus]|uniref:N-acetyltransferase domain-containing protein n=1 Tax=Vagococcus entomophilus TaxID=1160095 RepID=A0A430AG21_9ENTE|nr:GNAT family N-acetyltransferase [Vagococcus entomophilus]RSU06840.1 hypothetical protein CBF30_06115 [Vagococcus entomophilus]
MIRKIEQLTANELEQIERIWLEGNIQTHHYIETAYWEGNRGELRVQLPQATLYVAQKKEKIIGFTGVVENYIAGIFVLQEFQGCGIGTELLRYAKIQQDQLSLCVYCQNKRAIGFYQKEGFEIKAQRLDKETNQLEYQMEWQTKVSS